MITSISQKILTIGMILLAVVALLCVIVLAVMIKRGSKNKRKMILFSLVTIVIAGISWVTNMGYMRFFMTLCVIPFVHAIILFTTNVSMVAYIEKYRSVKILNILFWATYLISYFLFPDNRGVGESYLFFGLVKNGGFVNVAHNIAVTVFFIHLALFVAQLVLALVFDARSSDADDGSQENQEL